MSAPQNLTSLAPPLETSRLALRGHRLDDFCSCAALWANPIVTQYIGGKPLSEEEAWMRLLRYVGHWFLLGFGYWVVEEKATGKFLGEVGFAENQRDITPPLKGLLETGWVFAPGAHGQGFATESVLGALAWSDRHFPCTETACIIDPPNLPSLRVAQKCGYREIHRTAYKSEPVIVLVRQPAVG
jgi:RimJ/RimL family protein N-acetyltransferase